MTLKEAVNAIMDFSKAQEKDIHNSYARMSHMVKTSELDNITQDELDAARAFIDANYDTVVAARKNNDDTLLDEALEAWENGSH